MNFEPEQVVPGFDQIVEAVGKVGFPVVAFILIIIAVVAPLYALLRYVIVDAVRYFTSRLDDMTKQNVDAYNRLVGSIDRQTEQISLSREQGARNNEVLQIALQFMSHTQQEITAHRATVEPVISDEDYTKEHPVPSPPATVTKEDE